MMQNNNLGNVDKLHHRVLKTNVIQDSQGNSQWMHCRSKVVWDNVSDNCSKGLHKYTTVDVDKQYLYEPLTINWHDNEIDTTICQLHVHFATLRQSASYMFTFAIFEKWTFLLTIVAQIVTLCKDSLHADWILMIASIDANIEYTIVVDNMQCDQKLQGKWQQLLSAEKII